MIAATPRPTRRALLTAAGVISVAAIRPATAQQVSRTSRILVGFAPGGSADAVARIVADRLRGAYAPQVVVENRSGAGGRLAIEAAKGAAPDGATVLLTPSSMLTIYPRTTR